MPNLVSLQAIVYGHVQGVFFRAFVEEYAVQLGLTGYVRNLPSGREVEVRAEGDREQLEKLVDHLKMGPPAARIDKVTTQWGKFSGKFSHFNIQH